MPERPELKRYYDVVIVGAGSHGVAAAYGLRRRGITDVAILERADTALAGGGPELLRAAATVPADGRRHDVAGTLASARLHAAGLALYEELTRELGLPLSRRAGLTLAHSASAAAALAHRAQVDRLEGVESAFVTGEHLERLVPAMRASAAAPIAGALQHPRGGLVRREAVVRALARGAGAELHPGTAVTGLERRGGRIVKVRTSRGDVEAGVVLACAGSGTAALAAQAGVRLPVTTHAVRACMTEPVAPLLDVALATAEVWVAQTDGGALVMGAEPEARSTDRAQTTLDALRDTTRAVLELFPQLEHVRLERAWAGLCDLSAGPIAGRTEVENLHVSGGWGTCGLTVAPIVGKMLAELVDTGRTPELIAPFGPERFYEGH